MKNHEGYHDPTAGLAIRNIMKYRGREKSRPEHLTYLLKELHSFQKAARMIRRKRS